MGSGERNRHVPDAPEWMPRGVGDTEVYLLRLDELGVLNHRRLSDADEGSVRREQGTASRHRVTLTHS